MKYIFYLPCQLVCSLLCYLTNWLVVLFADEEGELPGILRLWQTWDDTLDNETDIGRLPKFLQYDWDLHYVQTMTEERGRTRYQEVLIRPFSFADRVRRYFCRCHWLYRNCAYGFAFYLFGIDIERPVNVTKGDGWYFASETGGNVWSRPWALKSDAQIYGRLHWKVYVGWKIQKERNDEYRTMIANRVWLTIV